MKDTTRRNDIINSFEASVFRYGMLLAIAFRLIRTVHEYVTGAPAAAIALGVFNILLVLVILRIHRRYYLLSFIIFFSQILITSLVTWNSSGGWNGVVPYILIIVIMAVVITSHGLLQVLTLLAYGLGILLFSSTSLPGLFSEPRSFHSLLSMEFDFLVSTLLLILITLYLKTRFFAYRTSAEATNTRLKQLSETLTQQINTLNEQGAELNAIKDNLESIALRKVSEVNTKTRVLDEYAFINAHHVRGPLARVLGLIHLIEIETPRHERSEACRLIKAEAQEMDAILQKINEIIG